MAERRTYAPNTWIWIPDAEAVWTKAEVLENDDKTLKVRVEETGAELSLSSDTPSHLCNLDIFSSQGLMGLDDLTQLTHLHEPAVLNSLNLRFDVDAIYTFTGPILIAVNPFKTIPGMYDMETIRKFLKVPDPLSVGHKRVPHVFATGAVAFRGLCSSKTSQTILISGESGAGKTESTKFVMKLLALAGSEDWNNRSQIENQVLQSNPLLEALGNAKTLRNDNSSRFGKFIEMQFILQSTVGSERLTGRLAGARIHTYLLETVRVCHQLEGERNYHSFYQLCAAAAAADENGQYHFPAVISSKVSDANPRTFDLSKFASAENFRFLTKSSCRTLKKIDDQEEFENTILAMQTIGIPHEDQVALFNLIGAVLYLGNIQFESPAGNSESSAIKAETINSFQLAAHLLGVTAESLQAALTFRTLIARGETFKIPLKVREADDSRDALAKALYGTAFLKLVKATNESIGYRPDVDLFCGVLDIFGFECFQYNSFEQLCINFTNERLQQFFNTFIFKCEEALYQKEGIPWSSLDFPDNQDCVELMEAKSIGIFAMLDEECIVPKGSDRGFCNKLKVKHKENVRFGFVKTKQEAFIINHFAGPVEYSSVGFLDKNRDQLSLDAQNCAKASSSPFVRSLFTEFLIRGSQEGEAKKAAAAAKKRAVTVSSEFRNQLTYLMSTVAVTEPHFIRCIKPNPRNRPDEFERTSVTEQLRYGGVLQAVQVSRAGYPVRLPHREAYLEYRHLCNKDVLRKLEVLAGHPPSQDVQKKQAADMMAHLDDKFQFPIPLHSSQSWAVGLTMVFFKHESYEVLSSERAKLRIDMATIIQSRWKGLQQRRFHQHLRLCTIIIQAHVRGVLARRRAQAIRRDRAARKLQKVMRGFLARRRFRRTLSNIILLQSAWRGHKARQMADEIRRHKAAMRIQAHWRGAKAREYYKALKVGTQKAQLRWRQVLAKRQLRRLKQEQREAAALLGQKQKLQEENKILRAKAEDLGAHLSLVLSEKEKLSVTNLNLLGELAALRIEFTTQEEKFRAQIEDLRASSLRRLSSTASTEIREKQERTASAQHGPLGSPESDVSTTPSPSGRLAPTPEDEPVEPDIPQHPAAMLQQPPADGSKFSPTKSPKDSSKDFPVGIDFGRRPTREGLRRSKTLAEDVHNSPLPFELEAAIVEVKAGNAELLKEKDSEIERLNARIAELESQLLEQTNRANESERRYSVLLKSEGLKGSSQSHGAPVATVPPSPIIGTPSTTATIQHGYGGFQLGVKSVDILLIGDPASGRSQLLHQLNVQYGTPIPARDSSAIDSGAVMRYHRIHFNNSNLVIAELLEDTPTDLVKDWAFKSHYLIIVYDVTTEASYRHAHQYIKMTSQHPHRMCFGNLANGTNFAVNLAEVKDHAARSNCLAIEGHSIEDVLPGICEELRKSSGVTGKISEGRSSLVQRRPTLTSQTSTGHGSGLSNFMTRIHSYFTTGDKAQAGGSAAKNIVLRPSVPETLLVSHSLPGIAGQAEGCLQPVVELPENSAAVICTAFGREKAHPDHYLLAAACKDGSVTVYKIYRTELEKKLWDAEFASMAFSTAPYGNGGSLTERPATTQNERQGAQLANNESQQGIPNGEARHGGKVEVHLQLSGHTRAITHLFFSYKEDLLVTTSIDKSVRFWSVETGDMLRVFADSTACLVAAFIPFNPHLFIVGNANSILRVVDVRNGQVLQKLRAESEVRAVKFDETGLYCYAGTRSGMLHVLESSDVGTIEFKFKTKVSKCSITCVTYVPSTNVYSSPKLFVNSCDSTITIVDCIYGQPTGALSTLTVRHRVKVAHSLMPLRCAYSAAGPGWLISASEDRNVYIYNLSPNSGYRSLLLRRHQAPVVTVSVNQLNTVLASADSCGKIILWRWMQFADNHAQA